MLRIDRTARTFQALEQRSSPKSAFVNGPTFSR